MFSDSEDSGDDNDRGDEEYGAGGVNLTSILFGNIDNNGELVDDILDEESRKHLGVLSKFGLNSILNEVIDNTNEEEDQGMDTDDEELDKEVKNTIAVDYSDFNELAEEDPPPDGETTNDKALMPPPLRLPVRNSSYSENGTEITSPQENGQPKKLETPLAAMLPSKYANTDVRELFPDFRPDKVLRFSRLFGPGKPTSLPQIWRGVKKRKKKKKKDRDFSQILNNVGSDSTSDSEEPRRKGFDLHYGPEPKKEQCMSDDEDKLLRIITDEDKKEIGQDNVNKNDNKPNVADWRYGPAQIWYDILEVPDSGEGFNYGFKSKDKKEEPEEEIVIKGEPIADDAYLLVSQLHWEDDVVWDGNDIKAKVLQKLNSKTNAAGWLPSSGSRTAGAFSQPGKGLPVAGASGSGKLSGQGKQKNQIIQKQEEVDDTWYSIFPVENEELIYGKWEDEIIWDADDMPKIPKPKILTLDPNDENIILGIPDDIDPSKINKNIGPPPKVKIPHPHVKKSKILLGKAGVINVLAEDTPPPPPKSPDRDPYNISNDSYYMPKTEPTLKLKVGGGNLIQHSTPVVELRSPFVPTYMGPMKLRNFHRPALKKYSHGTLAQPSHHQVQPLLKHIAKKAKQRETERIAAGGGDVFFMRNHEDLSGKDGDIILAEFCEEHPPLMNQVGMCSKIKNYYKRKAGKDSGPPEYPYGEVAYAHTSPFLGILQPGMCIQALENNMYRAPIYQQTVNPTDFLIIRTRNNYWVREINALYTVGQECPLYEVPGPNSKRANNFTRDFLQVFIYRLFWKSKDTPRRIRMDDIKKAFPAHSESSIRKRLKQCADFKRTGMDSNWWVIKPEFRLPSEEEIRAMVSPEQCCAYFSMIAAEQRLKDAGYGEKSLFAPQEDDDEETQLKMDDEVKVAPWNTTRAYIQAMRGKCLLQLTGPADPTGCGEGFSYVRVPNKPTQTKEEQESQPKRTVTGTDADLRRLPLNKAKELLRKFKVPDEEIKKLSRWEVIDVVRTLSTEKAKAGEQGMDKFSRGNRFSIAEHQERYKEECQRIFDLQNKVLASEEVLSTDEDESSASEESDLEEMGKNLENMLSNKKTSTQLSLEREEQERQELLKVLHEGGSSNAGNGKKKDDNGLNQSGNQRRILKITRTFKNSDGKEYTRVETVRKHQIIDAYVKIRTTKDENFIKQFATLDEQQKEEMKREKRRIQEQLRRIKRNQERERLAQLAAQQKSAPGGMPTSLGDPKSSGGSGPMHGHHHSSKDTSPSRRKFKLKPDLKLKCGACGQVGHMRTNKACPLYTGSMGGGNGSTYGGSGHENPSPTPPPPPVEPEEEQEKIYPDDFEDLVNVDGTKVTMSSKLLKHHEDIKRMKMLKEARRRRRLGQDLHCDYLHRQKTANRRRTDPVVTLSSILEEILNDLRDMPDVTPFMFPVNAKKVPDYYRFINRPMDLQSIRENLRQKKYQSREEFLADVNQIYENSNIYNGQTSTLTAVAKRMLEKCVEGLGEREDRLIRLEKAINPLLDDNDQVALSFIFERIVNTNLKTMPESYPFLKPVNKKQVKDYYTVIKRPMDFETISKKVSAHKYHSRADFLGDIELIANNCEQYNGSEAEYTKNAKAILQYANFALSEFNDHCQQLEENIVRVQEKAREDAELDASWDHSDIEHEMSHRYGRYSRSTTPEFDLDLDNEFRPPSRGYSKPSTSTEIPPQPNAPEVKRGRGRPRKNPLPEDGGPPKVPGIKRGRGRPRKDSNIANIQQQRQNSFLEEDLQYSESDNEDFDDKDDLKHHVRSNQNQMSLEQPNMLLEMQTSQDSQQNQFKYEQNMMESIPEEFEEYKDEQSQQYSMMTNDGGVQQQIYQQDLLSQYQQYPQEMKMDPSIEDEDEDDVIEQTEDDSNQQAVAEAMVELSGTGINKLDQQQQDDSFDPSDFLGLPQVQNSVKMDQESTQHFMAPPPVSNMSDLAPNDTFKQDLLQTAMELDQSGQMQHTQMMMQENPDHMHMMIHQQRQNPEELMMHQQQQQQNQEEIMLHQQHQEQMDQAHLMDQHMNAPVEMSAPMNQDIHDDLAISDSDDEDGKPQPPPSAIKTQENEDDDGGLWF